MPSDAQVLASALEHAKFVPHPYLPVGFGELAAAGLSFALVNSQGCLGYAEPGVRWVHQLASVLHARDERFRRGASLAAFRTAVAKAALEFFDDRAAIRDSHVATLNQRMEQWFMERLSAERRVIPCALLPRDAATFDVGPVRFVSAARIAAEGIALDSYGAETLLRMAREERGEWFALVSVRAESSRRSELADIAVDLALASLHLLFPEQHPMLRLTARAKPDWLGHWCAAADGAIQLQGHGNRTPGMAITGGHFERVLTANRALLDACGSNIAAFLAVDESANPVALAWCDAMHWYFEGTCDDLETTAIAKFEAALENLTSAESLHKSGSRIRSVISGVLGLSSNDSLIPGAPLTVKEFVEQLVEARSRVLHGTSSTLSGSVQLTREEVSAVVRQLLAGTALLMPEYFASAPATISVKGFQEWAPSTSGNPVPRARRDVIV